MSTIPSGRPGTTSRDPAENARSGGWTTLNTAAPPLPREARPGRRGEAERGEGEVGGNRAYAPRVAGVAAVQRLERAGDAPLRADGVGRSDARQDGAVGLLQDPVEDLHAEESGCTREEDRRRHAPHHCARGP